MDELEIKVKLDMLADFQAGRDAIALQKQQLIDDILNAEIKAKIADIEAEFADKLQTVNDNVTNLEAEVRQAVIENGASVKGTFLHAIWVKGRVSWDGKSLEGYMAAHPEIAAFRKEGEPSVSLRGVK